MWKGKCSVANVRQTVSAVLGIVFNKCYCDYCYYELKLIIILNLFSEQKIAFNPFLYRYWPLALNNCIKSRQHKKWLRDNNYRTRCNNIQFIYRYCYLS